MTPFNTLVSVTLRGLLGRRRLLLMLVLASIPVLLGALVQLRGGRADVERVLAILVVQTVMPIVALILGTASLGPEIEDGTIVYLLTKPIRRWLVAFAKIAVAVAVTAALVVPVTIVTGMLVGGIRARSAGDDVRLRHRLPGRRRRLCRGLRRPEHDDRSRPRHRPRLRAHLGRRARRPARRDALPLDPPGDARDRRRPARRTDGTTLQIGVSAVVLTIAILGSLLLTSWRLARFEVRAGD